MIVSYDETTDVLVFDCQCGNTINGECSTYTCVDATGECFSVQCTNCGDLTFLNMDIPIGAYDEYELEQTVMTPEEVAARHVLRDFMWAKRADLQLLDRAAVDQASYEANVPQT